MPRDHQLLAGSVGACIIERRDIVYRSDIIRSKVVVSGTIEFGLSPLRMGHGGMRPKIVQPANRANHVAQRFRNRWHRIVRIMGDAAGHVMPQCGVKRPADLLRGSSKKNPGARRTRVLDRESLGLQPCNDFGDVIRAGAKPVGELFRRQPIVIIGRRRIALIFEEGFELLLRGIRQAQIEADAANVLRCVDEAELVLGPGKRMNFAAQGHNALVIDRPWYPVGRCRERRARHDDSDNGG